MTQDNDVNAIAIRDIDNGIVISVRARPGASKDSVSGVHGDALKIAVRAAPENGKANDALVDLIASFFKVKRKNVRLLRGGASASKHFEIIGINASQARRIIQAAIDE